MLEYAVDFLGSLNFERFLTLFWYWVLFDFTRYIISLVPIIAVVIAEKLRGKPKDSAARRAALRDTPVSVLLAGHNEADSLEKTIRSIHEQGLRQCEIIVIDDGSTDAMLAVATSLQRQGLITTVLSTGIRSGKSAALNLGRHHCRHDIIIMADIDTTFDNGAFVRLLEPMDDPDVGAVSGNLGVRNASANVITRIQALEYLDSISVGRRFTALANILAIVSGAFGAFRKSALESIGFWEVGPGEDADITDKLRRAGWRIAFAPHAWALTDVPETLGAFARQRLRWNRSVIRFRLRKYRPNLNPFSAGFRVENALSTLNILFFQAGLAAVFFIYILSLPALYGDLALIILLTVSIFYIIEDFVIYVFIIFLYPERETLRLTPYLPVSSIFRAFLLRGIRAYAYMDELIFRRSYKDEYVPRRVLEDVERY